MVKVKRSSSGLILEKTRGRLIVTGKEKQITSGIPMGAVVDVDLVAPSMKQKTGLTSVPPLEVKKIKGYSYRGITHKLKYR